MLTGEQAKQLLAAETTLIEHSGDRGFDYALAQTLSRISDTLGVLPGFAYFDDSKSGPNAYAIEGVLMGKPDGTVLFGQQYLKKKLAWPEHPDVAVTATCAHEFGHILQFKLGLEPILRAGQATVKRQELHADYLAGYYAGTLKLNNPDYPAAVFADTRGGDLDDNKRDHHGTSEERAAAIVRGFEVAYRERRNLSDAVQIGVNYVSVL
jgi:predicted metalloprotease